MENNKLASTEQGHNVNQFSLGEHDHLHSDMVTVYIVKHSVTCLIAVVHCHYGQMFFTNE